MTEQSSQCEAQGVETSIQKLILGSDEGGTRIAANLSHHMMDETSS